MTAPPPIPLAHYAEHESLTPAEFVRLTRSRYRWGRDYARPGHRLVGGTCVRCGSDLSILVTEHHPLSLAAAWRDRARSYRVAALFREAEGEADCAGANRRLARLFERRAAELEGIL